VHLAWGAKAAEALRFHSAEESIIRRTAIRDAYRVMLQRPKLADLAAVHLARLEDWESADQLAAILRRHGREHGWITAPIVTYLEACPHPQAQRWLAELRSR